MSYPFPFGDVDLKKYRSVVKNLERIYEVQSLLYGDSEDTANITVEGITIGMRSILDNSHLDVANSVFADCFAHGCEGCLFASAFEFKSYLSVESTKESFAKASELIQLIPDIKEKVDIQLGSLQDYFPFHADVVYLNTSILRNTMCDEGIFVHLFWKLGQRMLAGSYMIVVTSIDVFPNEDWKLYECRLLATTQACSGTDSESTIWVFKTAGQFNHK